MILKYYTYYKTIKNINKKNNGILYGKFFLYEKQEKRDL